MFKEFGFIEEEEKDGAHVIFFPRVIRLPVTSDHMIASTNSFSGECAIRSDDNFFQKVF